MHNTRFSTITCVRYVAAAMFAFAMLAGCADSGNTPTTRPLTMQQRQDAALRDPFSYGGSTEKVDVTGGGLGEFDKKAMKRDLDSVFNP